MQNMIFRTGEQSTLPERIVMIAEEVTNEDETGNQCTDSQQEQRHQHNRR